MDNYLAGFADKLQAMMKARGETNQALGHIISINETYVSQLRNGHLQPTWETMEDLLKHYVGKPGGLSTPTEAMVWSAQAGYQLGPKELRELFPDFQVATPRLLPPALPATYVKRPKLEQEICQALEAAFPVILFGLSGSGKATLATAVSRTLEGYFSGGVLWLPMRQFDEAATLYQLLIRRLQLFWPPSVDLEHLIQSWLFGSNYLVCFDEITLDQVAWIEPCLPHGGQSRFLFTTIDHQVSLALKAAEMRIGLLNDEESYALLEQWTPRRNIRQTTWGPILVERLGGLPLALHLAGAQLQGGVSGADLVQLLTQENISLRVLRLAQLRHPHASLNSAFDMLLQSVDETGQKRFADLGVFVNHFTLDQAAMVWNCSAFEAHLQLQGLAQFALVNVEGTHYGLHSLLRDYARLRLTEQPDRERKVRQCHAAWFIRHELYHPGVLDKTATSAPPLTETWADVVTAIKWAMQYDLRLVNAALLLAHGERAALFNSAGASLIRVLDQEGVQTENLGEQALLNERLAEIQLWQHQWPGAISYWQTALVAWQEAGEILAAAITALRLAGTHLLAGYPAAALPWIETAHTLVQQAYPVSAAQLEDLRWVFYWFDIVFNALVRWPDCPESIAMTTMKLAQVSNHPIIEARGYHIYRLWWTAEDIGRVKTPADQKQVIKLSIRAFWLWRACGERDRADEEISWALYFLKGRYSQRTAARFARRLSKMTPELSEIQLKNLPASLRWWLGASEHQRIAWLSRMMPAYLGILQSRKRPLVKGGRVYHWTFDK